MKKIFAPWRSPYILTAKKPKQEGCVFCPMLQNSTNDKKHYVVKRGKHAAVLLNLYPYAAGHLLIMPYKHTADLENLNQEGRTELMELTAQAEKILKSTVKAEGINVGLNLGSAAGGGIPQHLHIHVLPRWNGDTNFMPLLCDTKVVSTDLDEVYQLLHEAFNQ